jgi:hypothetical protein
MGIKAMLEEEAEELAGGMNGGEEAKDLTAPLVSAEPGNRIYDFESQ